MRQRRFLRIFPKVWLDRYGDEFAALLDDLGEEGRLGLFAWADVLRLGICASANVLRFGALSRLSAPRARRRLFSLIGVLALAGAGAGLGLTLEAGAAQVSFIVSPPRLAVGADGTVALAQQTTQSPGFAAHEAACLLHPDYLPSGSQLLGSNDARGNARPEYRTTEARHGSVGSLHWALLSQAGPLVQSITSSTLLSAGGLSIAGHWYSLCSSLAGDGTGTTETGLVVVPGGQYEGRRIPGFIYGLVAPSSAKLILRPSSGRSVTPRNIATVAGLDLFLASLSSDPCDFTSLKMLQISPQTADSETIAVQPGCNAFSPLRTSVTGSSSASRTIGTIQSINDGGLVLRTRYWPPLHVGTTATTPFFVQQEPGDLWNLFYGQNNAQFVDNTTGSAVYIAGRVTGNHETASGIYLLSSTSSS